MKLDEIIKNKYLYSKKFNILKLIYFYSQFLKAKIIQNKRKLYSNWGLDIMADHFFKRKEKGVYIDVGCHHPFLNNNTYPLFKRGWSGINIDLDFNSIEMFNCFRKTDSNIQAAVSDKENETNLYFYHNRSAINTLSKDSGINAREIKKIKTQTLDHIIENSKFRNKIIDYLSIDVEGHELNVMKGFNLKKYKPKLIVLELINPSIKEFYLNKIENVLNSKIYEYMNENNYKLVNWIHEDLIFVPKDISN